MSYDVYGGNLRKGYCEVHPDMSQEYPCDICLRDANDRFKKAQELKKQEADYWKSLEEERMQIWYKEFEEFHKIQEYNNEQQ
ncbi:MAG: hypothetical protein ACOVNU_03990 [Candidatus Kapaibacteriota bacterium]